MRRVAAIGLDAAEWTYVQHLMESGALPNLAALRRRGAVATLQTDRHYRSEYPWTSLATGRSASDIGYWTTVTFDPVAYRCPVVGAAPVEPFFAFPGRRDIRVVALDLPHARIASSLSGAQVIGWGAHDPQVPPSSSPRGLLGELVAAHGAHPAVEIEYDGAWHQPKFLSRFADALVSGAERRVEVVEALLRRVPDWQLLLMVMAEPHTIGHHCWHGADRTSPLATAPSAATAGRCLERVHRAVDGALGRLLPLLGPDTTVLVFSVKGMEVADSEVAATCLVPELLLRAFLGRRLLHDVERAGWERDGRPPVILPEDRDQAGWLKEHMSADPARTRSRRSTVRRLAWGARRRLQRPVPTSWRSPTEDLEHWNPATWYRGDWPHMPAFVIPSFSDVHIRLNVRGREARGVVEPEDYVSTCDRVGGMLRRATDARTGASLVVAVDRMRTSPFDPGPPADVIVSVPAGVDALDSPEAGPIGPYPWPRTGSHSPRGFLIGAGPDLAKGSLPDGSVSDLAPTITALVGGDLAGFTGRALLGMAGVK